MRTLSLKQGSQEWIDTRLSHFTASEAPTMMGKSKYQKRDDLLLMKSTGVQKEVSDFTQSLFDKGHEAEEMARPLAEKIVGDELFSSTGSLEVDGIPLLASFDGITMDETIIWEHKLWNESLAQSIRDGKIEQHYLWQIGQQLIVSNADKCLFMTSDGTEENMEYCWITINGEFGKGILPIYAMKGIGGLGDNWKDELMQGWADFKQDLESFEPPVELEANEVMNELLTAYSKQKEAADLETNKLKALKQEIDRQAKELGAKHIIGNGFKVDMVERQGTVNYKAIPELTTVNLDDYRNKPTVFFQIKPIDKQA